MASSSNQKTKQPERRNLNVIDLFCGCGGFSEGFKQAGFKVRYGLDIWKDAVETYKLNFPEAATMVRDITEVNGNDILKAAKMTPQEVDVIIGGPPCQGFSLSGKRLLTDERNELYKSYVRIVKELRPKVFVMENVPGLVRLFGGKVKEHVMNDFTSLGYNVKMQILTASDYSVPQSRKRVFFVGVNKDVFPEDFFFTFPEPQCGEGKQPYVTCKDAISDLDFIGDTDLLSEHAPYGLPAQSDYQRMIRKGSTKLLNHVAIVHKEKTRQIIAMVPDGGNYKDLPQELWSTRKVNIAWTRMSSNRPCFTIDTGHNHHFHYRANRVPSVRESARIQSFPDTFEFLGIKTSQLRQVGNAVPPLLAKAIALQIKSTT